MDRVQLNQYLISMDFRYQNDVDFWKNEFRCYPLAPVASSLARALQAQQIYKEIQADIYALLDQEETV